MISKTQLNAYFKRINFKEKPLADLKTLQKLQFLHVKHIPFENFNPLLKIPVRLELENIFEKLVLNNRGGYCFEQNILFLEILKTIGFQVRGLMGRVILNKPVNHLAKRTHMLILVKIDEIKYICDVGFGSQVLTTPILLKSTLPQKTTHENYRIFPIKNHYVLQAEIHNEWINLYKFDLQKCYHLDYVLANWYTSANPNSHFTKKIITTRVDENCRYLIHNNKFKIHYLTKKSSEETIINIQHLKEILKKHFALSIPTTKNAEQLLTDILKETP